MAKYVANWPIDGIGRKRVNEGDFVTLDEDAAEPLIAAGALSPAAKNAEQLEIEPPAQRKDQPKETPKA